MIHQKNDENLDNLLQTVLGRRNTGQLPPGMELRRPQRSQPPPVKELRQPQLRNSENNSEQGVICPKEGNSSNLESIQGDTEVALPFGDTEVALPFGDTEVALSCQEGEENLEDSHEQEGAETCEARDLTPTPLNSGVEGEPWTARNELDAPLHG